MPGARFFLQVISIKLNVRIKNYFVEEIIILSNSTPYDSKMMTKVAKTRSQKFVRYMLWRRKLNRVKLLILCTNKQKVKIKNRQYFIWLKFLSQICPLFVPSKFFWKIWFVSYWSAVILLKIIALEKKAKKSILSLSILKKIDNLIDKKSFKIL